MTPTSRLSTAPLRDADQCTKGKEQHATRENEPFREIGNPIREYYKEEHDHESHLEYCCKQFTGGRRCGTEPHQVGA